MSSFVTPTSTLGCNHGFSNGICASLNKKSTLQLKKWYIAHLTCKISDSRILQEELQADLAQQTEANREHIQQSEELQAHHDNQQKRLKVQITAFQYFSTDKIWSIDSQERVGSCYCSVISPDKT
jgi:hypothetical protein